MDGRRSVGLMHQYFPYDTHSGYSDVMVRRRPQSSFEAKAILRLHLWLFKDKIQTILYKTPPPSGYFHLPPMEKAAYLFYFVLYNRYFTPVEEFHNRFNREFFKYSCEGDSAETALWKICKHTQEEYVARRSAYQLKAYEKTQKQLFSDDRETPDSSFYCIILLLIQLRKVILCQLFFDSKTLLINFGECFSYFIYLVTDYLEPLKFRTAHAFAKFCVGGKVLVVNPENALSVIEIHDVKSFAADSETQLLIETIEMFHGPLIPGVTPPHSVSLYIQRQIDHILKSDIYKANPHGSDASDCLLVWQLLKMIVQQQGRVTGPDIARLLMCDYDSAFIPEIYRSVFGSGTNDGSGFQRYMKFLLGGHVDEAIECAIKDGLLLDAMVLARWVCPHKLDKVDAAFLAQRAEQNPVMTLLSVAHDLPAPILLNPPTDDAGSWRSHAAIILANLSTDTAFKMVYNLGRVLARREYHAAADFCFLAVSLLSDCDPFALNATNEDDDAQDCQHITLVHASLPDDKIESRQCSFGFSVVDLHATEIYEYGLRLACNGQPVRLTQCCDYQKYRFKYAQLLSEYGGFAPDAYHYCVEIAKGIADKWMEYGKNDMLQLCDMADRTLSFGLEAAEWHADHQEPIQISPFTSSGATATSVFTPQEQQNQQTQPQESQSLDVFTVPESKHN
uniref:Protein transport protein sec16 n=1 Tax=Syphacia muris TaxID=451379 RepID=A0A158R625_9BILA